MCGAYESTERVCESGVPDRPFVERDDLVIGISSEALPQTDKSWGGPGWSERSLDFRYSRTSGGRTLIPNANRGQSQ